MQRSSSKTPHSSLELSAAACLKNRTGFRPAETVEEGGESAHADTQGVPLRKDKQYGPWSAEIHSEELLAELSVLMKQV